MKTANQKSLIVKQLSKYLITGFTAFGLEYLLYLILYQGFHIHYILSSMVVYALIFMFSFITNRKWTFQSSGNIKRQTILYFMLFLFNLVVSNLFLLKFFTEVIGLSPLISPFFKMACVVCWNFVIYKWVIYKD